MNWTLAILCGVALAKAPIPEPTAFEAFALKPSAQTLVTKHVGSIVSSDAKVSATVLIMKDIERPSTQMRGVRFDLENNTGADHIYLDEAQLATVKRELAMIQSSREQQAKEGEVSAPYQVEGTQSCWRPDPAVRVLCPSHYVGPDHTGLILNAFGGPAFEFPDHQPAELADLIERIAAELQRHPR